MPNVVVEFKISFLVGFFHLCFLLNICFVYDIIVYVIEQKVGCDFPIVRRPLVYKGG